MQLLIVILISAVIVLTIYYLIHRTMIKRATLILQNHAQKTTDQAMAYALKKMLNTLPAMAKSKIVADVWGKGVLAFEYTIDLKYATQIDQVQLSALLNEFASQKNLKPLPQTNQVFVVSDWWQYEKLLHIDVAYVYNEATREYVSDLKKLAQAN